MSPRRFTRHDALALAVAATLGALAGVGILWLVVRLGVFTLRIPV